METHPGVARGHLRDLVRDRLPGASLRGRRAGGRGVCRCWVSRGEAAHEAPMTKPGPIIPRGRHTSPTRALPHFLLSLVNISGDRPELDPKRARRVGWLPVAPG